MSSVLRALKKLEKENDIVVAQSFWPPNSPVVASGFRTLVSKAGYLLLLTFSFFVAMILHDRFTATKQAQEIPRATKLDSQNKQIEKGIDNSRTKTPEPTQLKEGAVKKKAAVSVVTINDKSPTAVTVDELPEIPETALPVVQPEKTEENITPVVPSIYDGDDLNLRAIAWSNDAKKRVAVLNDSVVHESDRVSGYLLLEIKPDELVLEKEGEAWLLPLNK